ncbi:MAG: SiaB family protein kinase, partial [Bacteroidia bacterium]
LKELSSDHTIIVKHFGDLAQESISSLEGQVESSIIESAIAKGPLRKIFFISVETLQNMLIHGHKNLDGQQRSFFILTKDNTKVDMISANLISNKAVPILEKQIETINDFEDPATLKQYYMEHLENNQLSEKGGAGLGFITIAMKSGNKLKVSFEKIDENYSLFLLNSTVNID